MRFPLSISARLLYNENMKNHDERTFIMTNILICDDERDIVCALKIYLSEAGYGTLEAYNGKEALRILSEHEVHLVLMDIMMPEMDGIAAMREIRRESNIPVILLTAKSEEEDKIEGLDAGADDYITKPFRPAEVIARVRSQLRRYLTLGGTKEYDAKIVHGGIVLDNREKTISVDGDPVVLTPTEFEILKLLLQNAGTVFSPKEIYRRIWNDSPYGAEGTVAVHIRRLREKIEITPAEPRYLKTIWGQGYRIEKHMQARKDEL